MGWITRELPEMGGEYLVTLEILGQHTLPDLFLYVAYFSEENRTWHKYDPFVPELLPGEDISKYVVGWKDGVGVYMKS